jgi:hypothetical protein
MIRCSTLSLSQLNAGKRKALEEFIDEYRRVAGLIVDELWQLEKVPRMFSTSKLHHVQTFLSRSAVKSVADQCSGIIRGTRQSAK